MEKLRDPAQIAEYAEKYGSSGYTNQEVVETAKLLVTTTSQRDEWKRRAEAAEAKLNAQCNKKAVGIVNSSIPCGASLFIDYLDGVLADGVFLFTRPAADLAELVEDETTLTAGVNALVDCLEDCGDAEQGLRLALRAILRNIEEASKK